LKATATGFVKLHHHHLALAAVLLAHLRIVDFSVRRASC
jgi:hypothetical protein